MPKKITKTNETKPADTEFGALMEKEEITMPKIGDTIKGTIITASKSEIKLDLNGVMVGVVRGKELYRESPEYANLKAGDEVEATVIDLENENGELELSFSYAGHQKAWSTLTSAFENQEIIIVKVNEANKGGLIVSYGQIAGFLPVSQLSPENYPRVGGGDKSKIFEKLKSFTNKEMEVKVMDLSEKEDKLIVSEKLAWSDRQKDVIAQYKPGSIVEGIVTAVTSFGVFISFGEGLEGLIHISELAWQRIENPSDIVKTGDKIKAEIINIDGAKIFLSAKKLIDDPWKKVKDRYQLNSKVQGTVLKVNPFGLFVQLDDDIHALAHISSLGLKPGEKINEKFSSGKSYDFYIISIEPEAHRLGLSASPLANLETKKSAAEKEAKSKKSEAVEEKAPE
jgi:ribosomal protein S1